MLAIIMQVLDSTIANVALPHMKGSLSATQDQITWVLTSYIVAAAIGMPLTGMAVRKVRPQTSIPRIGREFHHYVDSVRAVDFVRRNGRRAVAARLVRRGARAALAGDHARFNPPHVQAMAVWGMEVTVGPICPALDGWLTDAYNWRWVFYVNVPIGVIAFLGVFVFMRETKIDCAQARCVRLRHSEHRDRGIAAFSRSRRKGRTGSAPSKSG